MRYCSVCGNGLISASYELFEKSCTKGIYKTKNPDNFFKSCQGYKKGLSF